MGLNSPKLSLDLISNSSSTNSSLLPPPLKPLPDLLSFLSISSLSSTSSSSSSRSEESTKLKRYVEGLIEEKRKIEAFSREFPLSLVLLNEVIDRLKDDEEKKRREKKCRRSNSDGSGGAESEFDEDDKRNWMSSAQLWCSSSTITSTTPSPSTFLQLNPPARINKEDDRVGSAEVHGSRKYNDSRGAILSFHGVSDLNQDAANLTLTQSRRPKRGAVVIGSAAAAVAGGNGLAVVADQIRLANKMPNPPYLTARKQRRCWSPELHRRFIDTLEKLGGSQVATPKQIRDLMQVEGLTNDEVKSHLQKYRLHIQKVPSSSPTSSNEISLGQVLQLDLNSKAGTSFSDSPEGPFQLMTRSTNCNFSTASGESSMEEDQRSDGRG